MRTIFSLIIIFIFTTNLYGQIDSTKIAFVAYWSIGDSYDFKVSKIHQQWKEGELTKDQKHEYIANFTVIDSTENFYTINWSFENNLGSTYNIPEELLYKFSKYKLTEIKYKTSEVGVFLEILNWEEVGKIMNNMFCDIIEVLGENDEQKQDALKMAMQPFKQVYSSKQGVEQMVLKELQYLHFPMGLEYNISKPIFYDEELPNMFGGNPIKAKAKLYFENVDFDENYCVVKQEMSLDPNDTRYLLKQIYEQMKIGDTGMNEFIENAKFQVEDKNVYEYYFYPGIPHRIETTRETILNTDKDKGKRIDKTIIELIYNE